MAHIVVIGASTGGLPAAYELKATLGTPHHITVVSNSPIFHFVPSNPWVAVGWRTRSQISFELGPRLRAKGIEFNDSGVNVIDPDLQQLTLGDKSKLDYDYLIIATGASLGFDEIPGLGSHHGYTESICTVEHAESAYSRWQQFLTDPGPIVIGAVQGASCFGPAYEYAFIVNRALRKARLRDRVPITFITAEPYIGHMGLGGVGDSKGLFESEFRQCDIKWLTNARVNRIEPDRMVVEQVDAQGQTIQTHQLPFRYSMLIPAFKGIDCVANLGDDLVNPRGFLKVDEFQRNPVYSNIYGVGVSIAIPSIEVTPLPVGVPKTGYMIESMAKAAVANIKADIEQKNVSAQATWNALCLADMGHTGAAFIASPQLPPRNVAWMKKGQWVRWGKMAFEKYFIFKMKQGLSEPLIEKAFLRALGVHKLK